MAPSSIVYTETATRGLLKDAGVPLKKCLSKGLYEGEASELRKRMSHMVNPS